MIFQSKLLSSKIQNVNSINSVPLSISLTFPITCFKNKESLEKVQLNLKNRTLNQKSNYVIHKAYIIQRYNERQGTANTLTRAQVRGGGRKPWRQKGTGRARAGSNRSPLWRGGGVTFGPKSKIYSHKINRKEWRIALCSLLFQKEKNITIFDNLETTYIKNKTNIFKQNFAELGFNFNIKTVIIVGSEYNALCKVTKNIKTIKVLPASCLNLKQILYAKQLFITKDSLKSIEEIYND